MISVRKATASDAEKVFAWRNDEEARAVSRRSDKVSWEAHAVWFAERILTDHPESIWMVEQAGGDGEVTVVGTARINHYEHYERSEISIILAPEHRNKGIGREAIETLATMVRELKRVPVAFVRPENRRSLNTFRAAGFRFVDPVVQLEASGRDDG